MEIDLVRQSLREAAEEELLHVAAAVRVEELSAPLDALTALFEALGICYLLADLNVAQYRVNLIRAGYARRYYLRRCAAEGVVSDRRLAFSRTDAVFDALAAKDPALARAIADLSRAEWRREWEYRDDHCYFALIHQLAGGVALEPAERLLEEFDAALEGQSSSRLNVCRALLFADAADFQESWHALMSEIEQDREEKRPRMTEPDIAAFLFWPRSFVSVEGLALLQLAELRGLDVDVAHHACPPAARDLVSDAAVPDPFEEMDRVR